MKNRFNGSDGLDADLAILTLNQQQGESCTSYFTRILKVTAGRDYPDALITSIALKGLSADLKSIVMPQGHNSVEELRKAAILAERTVSATMTAAKVNSVDDITNKVLSAVTDKLSEVMAYDRGGSQSPSKWNQQQPPRQVQPRREQPQQQFDQNCSRYKGRFFSTHECGAKDIRCDYCGRRGHYTETCYRREQDMKNNKYTPRYMRQ